MRLATRVFLLRQLIVGAAKPSAPRGIHHQWPRRQWGRREALVLLALVRRLMGLWGCCHAESPCRSTPVPGASRRRCRPLCQPRGPCRWAPWPSASVTIRIVTAEGLRLIRWWSHRNRSVRPARSSPQRRPRSGRIRPADSPSAGSPAGRGNGLADRHNCETRCDRTGLRLLGGQVAMGAWGCQTKPNPRGIPCPAAC
jgi:hypothetical protein